MGLYEIGNIIRSYSIALERIAPESPERHLLLQLLLLAKLYVHEFYFER